jgi:hypothetical protein
MPKKNRVRKNKTPTNPLAAGIKEIAAGKVTNARPSLMQLHLEQPPKETMPKSPGGENCKTSQEAGCIVGKAGYHGIVVNI